jgi:hypothetical protein
MGERFRRAFRADDHYGLVLFLLTVSFVLSAFLTGGPGRILPLAVDVAALGLALRSARPARVHWRTLVTVLVTISTAAAVTTLEVNNRAARAALALWLSVLLTVATVAVVRRVLSHQVVTLQTIFGALSAYLLIGFLFAALFSAVAYLNRAPLFAGGQPANYSTIQYFSFATMTTVGYGDFVAAGEPTRSLAVLEALTGQIFLVTLVARLVSSFGQQRTPRG